MKLFRRLAAIGALVASVTAVTASAQAFDAAHDPRNAGLFEFAVELAGEVEHERGGSKPRQLILLF